MTKKIYLHSPNLEHMRILKESVDFTPVVHYGNHEYANLLPNELGKFQMGGYELRILLGNLRNRSCPWCGNDPEFKVLETCSSDSKVFPLTHTKYCMECKFCGSRGPTTTLVNTKNRQSEDYINVTHELVSATYMNKLAWDFPWKDKIYD